MGVTLRCGHHRELLGSYPRLSLFQAYVARVESVLACGSPGKWKTYRKKIFPLVHWPITGHGEWSTQHAHEILSHYLPILSREIPQLPLAWLQLLTPSKQVLWEHPSLSHHAFLGTSGLEIGVNDSGIIAELSEEHTSDYPELQPFLQEAKVSGTDKPLLHAEVQPFNVAVNRRYSLRISRILHGSEFPHFLGAVRQIVQCLPREDWVMDLVDHDVMGLMLRPTWKLSGQFFDWQLTSITKACQRSLEQNEEILFP